MFCRNCGTQLPDGADRCPVCGTPVVINEFSSAASRDQGPKADQNFGQQQPQPDWNYGQQWQGSQPGQNFGQQQWQGSQPQPDQNVGQQQPQSAPGAQPSITINLGGAPRVAAVIFAILYLISTIGSFGSVIVNGLEFTAGIRTYSVTAFIAAIVMLISTALMTGALGLFAARRNSENADYLCLTLLIAGIVKIIASVIRMVLLYVSRSAGNFYIFSSPAFVCIRSIIYVVITAGVLFAVLYATGYMPFSGMTADDIFAMIKNIPEFLNDEINGLSSGSSAKNNAGPAEKKKMKTNRNIIVFIILSCCTLGIYALYFEYKMAKDINQVCGGDGEKTTGLFLRLIFTLCTCGLYEFYWQYAFAERMAKNADRFGVKIRESGMTILVWYILGILTCGLAQFVALFLQIKNLNALCRAYNLENFAEE